jgi:hypothetical protein
MSKYYMNERLIEFAEQAGVTFNSLGASYAYGSLPDVLERFAELVRQDEAKACAEHYLKIMRDAVEQAVLKEREACAMLLEDWSKHNWNIWDCAKAIRARKESA